VLALRSPVIVCLFVLPILFASVLLNQRAVIAVSAVAGLIAVGAGLKSTRIPGPSTELVIPLANETLVRLFSSEVLLPIGLLALVTAATLVSSHSLPTVLAWVWSGYERARRNERIARNHEAELKRALKALDEATHRLERANYNLTLARDQAEEARRIKQQFAQNISHELRTPLNLIVSFVELMAQSPEYYGSPLPPAYLRDLGIVYRNACHLQGLVNDVLDLARIEAAQMTILPEESHPAALVREAVATARSLVEVRGLALYTEIESDLPELWLDTTRIRQVLFNLLNNAARFTEQGSITVSVRRQGGEVIVAVADTGVGIAAKDIPRIFEEFQQLDGSTRRFHDGAGLGLTISQRFVELHGGRMWVESEVGKGSTFYFSLPMGHTDLSEDAANSPTAARPLSAKGSEEPVLLAITRSQPAALLLARGVRGWRTVVVQDLEQARHTAEQLMPQVVVIDRAYTALSPAKVEKIAREWGLPHTQFLVCPLPGERRLHRRLIADGYMVKPISREVLWDVLRQFGEDVDRVMIIDDDQDFVLLLSRMLENNPVRRYQVISAGSGQEALALMRQSQQDLVLLDLRLPDIDGFRVIEHVRSNPAWQHIPVIIVSGQDELDHQEVLTGSLVISRADGMMPGEVMRWIQNAMDKAVTPFPAHPGQRGASAQ
jgi:signal transduction histidine kinase/CheY-like chemotaxis protein